MTENIWVYDTKKSMDKLIPWIYEQIDKSSDRYIRMRLSALKKEFGKTFEDMHDAEFYWRLKPILFDSGIMIGSVILKDDTEAITMRMRTEKDKSPMIGNTWTYDIIRAEERSEHFLKTLKLIDEEKDDNEREEVGYLNSLNERERKELSGQQKFWREEREKLKKKIEERSEKYDGGMIIASESVDIDNGINKKEDSHTFTAVLKNGKIGIFLDDGHKEWLFCDFLRNEIELDLFFDSIDIRSEPIDGQYRRFSKNGYAEHIYIGFDVDEMIDDNLITLNFSHGSWFSQTFENEEKYPDWDLDTSSSDRDVIIDEIKEYMQKKNFNFLCTMNDVQSGNVRDEVNDRHKCLTGNK